MLQLRKIVFYLFVLAYCVSCPVIIFYALGYILKPGAEHGIVKAGLIYLSTSPPGATVYVENKRFAEKTPAQIRGLLPGDYHLTVYLKNYKLWTQTVSIQPEKAVTFDKILLLPSQWHGKKILEGKFDDLVPVQSPRYLILAKGSAPEDLLFYDLKDKTLLSKDVRAYDLFGKKIYTVNDDIGLQKKIFPKGKFIFFGRQGEILSNKPFFRVGGERVNGAQFDAETQKMLVWRDDKLGVSDLSFGPATEIQWVAEKAGKISQAFWVHGGSHILFRDGNQVYLLELADGGMEPEECFQVQRGSAIFYSEKTGKIYYLEKGTGQFCVTDFVRKNETPASKQDLSEV